MSPAEGASGVPGGGIEAVAVALADGIEAALPGWVEASVARIATAWSGEVTPEAAEAARGAGERAAGEVGPAVRRLLASDIDEQTTTPLAIIRQAVRYPTAVLRDLGVPEVERDDFDRQRFPDDTYGLTPASLSDLDPQLGELGIVWGAAKAFEHRRRHAGPQGAESPEG